MRTRVKVCGITHHEDALAALNAGADALGFIFSPSPRQISPEDARSIIERLPPFTQVVGVFVNEPRERVQRIIRYCRLAAIQLQGDETNEYCQTFDVPVIKSFHLDSTLALERINGYQVSAYLLDTQVEGISGGSGKTFDWALLKNKTFVRPVIVAGGLHTGNVSHLIQHCFPTAIDVCSGVSRSARRKDPVRLQTFFDAVADADRLRVQVPAESGQEDILKASFDRQPLVEIQGRRFLLNALTEQIPATPAELLREAARRVCYAAQFPPGTKLVGEEDKGGGLLAAVSLLSGLPYGIARWYPSGLEGQVQVDFDCEYTGGSLFLNGVEPGDNVYIVDDLISTGGTLVGLVCAVRKAGADVSGILCVVEKRNYGGARRVFEATGISVQSLIEVDVSGEHSVVVGVNY
ncbi:phosphoribosylanthranilate isomerase [Serratia bockelmannii]|uniref:phosphoribosylanthranilate isomerase n=1 Tax=Serratia bockelmannii TaxID=2703793 RepID=UPI003FA68EF2